MPSGREFLLALALLLSGCSPARGVPIFLWHAVGTDCAGDAYDVSAEEFERELGDLERWGATPVTLKQLMDARDGHGTLPARPVVLTFDDGRLCQLTTALPILERHNMVAETFIITGNTAEDAAHRGYDPDGKHGYLTWPELAQLERSGHFVVESHGLTHTRMSAESEAAQKRELVESRQLLEARLGHPVAFFAYPFGAFNSSSRDLAEAAGYRAAMAVQKGVGTRYGILRTSLHSGDEPAVQATLRSAFGAPARP